MQATEAYIIRLLWCIIVGKCKLKHLMLLTIEGSGTIFWSCMFTTQEWNGLKLWYSSAPRKCLHTFHTHPAHVLDASHVWKKGAWQLRKPCCIFIVRFGTYTNSSRVCPRRILHAFQMRLACITDTFRMRYRHVQMLLYLGAELYRNYLGNCTNSVWNSNFGYRRGWPRECFVRRLWYNFLHVYQEVGNTHTEHLHSVGVEVQVYKYLCISKVFLLRLSVSVQLLFLF